MISVADKSLAGAIELHLPKAAAISGRILDSRGDPVVGMTVTAEMLTADPPEQPTTLVVATTELDDLGEYRLGGLPDGTFVVSVNVVQLVLGPNGTRFQGDVKTLLTVNGSRVPSDALGGERRTYYPGVADPARRGAITLALGEERASVDFAVQAMPPLAWSSVLGQSCSALRKALACSVDEWLVWTAVRFRRCRCVCCPTTIPASRHRPQRTARVGLSFRDCLRRRIE